MDYVLQPWPWYVSGPLIALVMALLLLLGKHFGMSSNLRTICTLYGAGKLSHFFRFDWRLQQWNLLVALGVFIGGFLAANYLTANDAVAISDSSVNALKALGFSGAGTSYMPSEFFANEALREFKTVMLLLLGGFLVGFGARYAGGCTSGHAISGLSNLQLPSLIAVIGFFIGGLVMVHLLFPLIFI